MQTFTRHFYKASYVQRATSTTFRPTRPTRLSTPSICRPLLPHRTYLSATPARLQDSIAKDVLLANETQSAQQIQSAQKRKNVRSPGGKASLRRVAAEAQRSRENVTTPRQTMDGDENPQVTAVTAADQFDMEAVARILRSHGFPLNPDETDFEQDEIIHTRGVNNGDIFVFPSGTVVAWGLPEDVVIDLGTKTLLPAAVRPHVTQLEIENLEYAEDDKRDASGIKGDVITLGTKTESAASVKPNSQVDTTLAKIAFSSGLARSTKLAVLETMLGKYFESTRKIPTLLSRGSRLPFNRSFMLQKTGELLELRAQLNHYSELTDSLPDLFWDARHELGLEGYYDQVGRALDVGVRIKALNEKMDYAQEIATILRQTMSEKHGVHLEWIIIILIAVEVFFALRKEWKERMERRAKEAEA